MLHYFFKYFSRSCLNQISSLKGEARIPHCGLIHFKNCKNYKRGLNVLLFLDLTDYLAEMEYIYFDFL